MELFVIIVMLFFFAYCFDSERARKKKQLEQDRQWEEKQRQIDRDYEIGNQIAARRAAEPMIINLTITERDANGLEIGGPKPLSVKISLDKESASRLVQILRD